MPAITKGTILNSLQQGQQHLLKHQEVDYHWSGDICFNAWTNAGYIIMCKHIGLNVSLTKVTQWILDHQNPDGTWGILDIPSPGLLEPTAVCSAALGMIGVQPTVPLHKAEKFIVNQGGIGKADPFTQALCALAGTYMWEHILIKIPPELLLVPGLYKPFLPTWVMLGIVPLSIITSLKPTKSEGFFDQLGLKAGERWLLAHQNSTGSWYDTALPTISAIVALYELGYSLSHPCMKRAIDFMHSLIDTDGYVHRFRLPVWDTALSVLALSESGISPSDPALVGAGQYIIDAQTRLGGIAFSEPMALYPDVDDTSLGLAALTRISMPDEAAKNSAIQKAIRWILFMQNDDGSWAAFTKNQATKPRGGNPTFKDDPGVADIVGHVFTGLGRAGFDVDHSQIQDGLQWLKDDQLDEGEWYGRWGLAYLYGTGAVLVGLKDLKANMNRPFIQAAVMWLLHHQNSDGGWGEDFYSYYSLEYAGIGESTAEQTAWSLMGLLSAGVDPTSDAIEKGIRLLIDRQQADGGWESKYTVGALWVYRNTLYGDIFANWALGMYKNVRGW